MNAIDPEFAYFAVAGLVACVVLVGAVALVFGVEIATLGQSKVTILLLATGLVASYYIYLQFFPDTYECELQPEGNLVVVYGKPREARQMETTAGPVSSLVLRKCRPLVTTLGQRYERALSRIPEVP